MSQQTIRAYINKKDFIEFAGADDALLFSANFGDWAHFSGVYRQIMPGASDAEISAHYDALRSSAGARRAAALVKRLKVSNGLPLSVVLAQKKG